MDAVRPLRAGHLVGRRRMADQPRAVRRRRHHGARRAAAPAAGRARARPHGAPRRRRADRERRRDGRTGSTPGSGRMVSMDSRGQPVLRTGPRLDVWRPPTSNETYDWGTDDRRLWHDIGLDALRTRARSVQTSYRAGWRRDRGGGEPGGGAGQGRARALRPDADLPHRRPRHHRAAPPGRSPAAATSARCPTSPGSACSCRCRSGWTTSRGTGVGRSRPTTTAPRDRSSTSGTRPSTSSTSRTRGRRRTATTTRPAGRPSRTERGPGCWWPRRRTARST